MPEITPVEETPIHVAGVINLRGRLIPVMDLNICFGRIQPPYGLSDNVVVVEKDGWQFGFIVNEVLDVIPIPPENVDPPPFRYVEDTPRSRFVCGEARVREDIIMILDYHRVAEYENCGMTLPVSSETDGMELLKVSVSPSPSFSGLSSEERGIFHHRAVDLTKKIEDDDIAGLCQVAVVCLSNEFFGIDLKSVREFSNITHLTPVPNCPEYIVGNMNLRGNILTVIDIRSLLKMPEGIFQPPAKVIVPDAGDGMVGIAVDDVFDIAYLSPSQITPLPASVRSVLEKFAKGTALYAGSSMTVLDISEIMRIENITAL